MLCFESLGPWGGLTGHGLMVGLWGGLTDHRCTGMYGDEVLPLLKEPVAMMTSSVSSSLPPLTSHRQLTATELQEVCPTALTLLPTYNLFS